MVLASTYPRWEGDHEPGFVHELCRRLTDRFDVIVVTSRSPGAAAEECMDGVEVVRYGYAPRAMETLVYGGGIATHLKRSPWKLTLVPGFILGQHRAAQRIMRRHRVDLIHAHWLIPQGTIARRLAHRTGVPYVVTSHGGDLFGLRGVWPTKLKRKVAADSAAMTVVSSAMREEAQRIGLAPPRLDVLPMGADMHSRFTPAADASVADGSELLFVGRLVAKKGLPHLLDAMPAVLRERPTAHLTIAGFGPEEGMLKAQTSRLGIDGAVHFLGAVTQDKLPALYRRAALLVAPFVRDASGNQEGLPVVLMEAIACGCPVLAGNVSGVEDLFGGAAAEICVDPTDTKQLAAAIVATLGDPQGAHARARALRETVVGRLDWSVIAERYGDLLLGCLRNSRSVTASAQEPPHQGHD
jgi:glycosyltransferase involved in cell wall biosynthesis